MLQHTGGTRGLLIVFTMKFELNPDSLSTTSFTYVSKISQQRLLHHCEDNLPSQWAGDQTWGVRIAVQCWSTLWCGVLSKHNGHVSWTGQM